MKIKGGPKMPGGPDMTAKAKAAGQSEAPDKSEAARFKDRLAAPAAARPAAPIQTVARATPSQPALPVATSNAIRDQLRTGQISRPEAIRRIIDAVATEGPGKSLSAAQREALKEHLTR